MNQHLRWKQNELSGHVKREVEKALAEDSSKQYQTPKQKQIRSMALGKTDAVEGIHRISTKDLCVHLTRVYSGHERSYDDDNLSGGFKYIRDIVTKACGCKDDTPNSHIQFVLSQEKGQESAIVIEIWDS